MGPEGAEGKANDGLLVHGLHARGLLGGSVLEVRAVDGVGQAELGEVRKDVVRPCEQMRIKTRLMEIRTRAGKDKKPQV